MCFMLSGPILGPAMLTHKLFAIDRWRSTFDHIPSLHGVLERLIQKNFLPAIFFVFSRKECDEDAMLMHKKGVILTSEEEQQIIRAEVENLR